MQTRSHLRALVVHESMFHNTDAIARAVGRGLALKGFDVTVVPASVAPALEHVDADLLVVGAPTHVFSLSRPPTRSDAVRRGASPEVAALGIREWLGACPATTAGRVPLTATFDTRIRRMRSLPKSAGVRGRHLLQHRGFTVIAPAEGFLVDDFRGPLRAGEIEHAMTWGRALGRTCQMRLDAATLLNA